MLFSMFKQMALAIWYLLDVQCDSCGRIVLSQEQVTQYAEAMPVTGMHGTKLLNKSSDQRSKTCLDNVQSSVLWAILDICSVGSKSYTTCLCVTSLSLQKGLSVPGGQSASQFLVCLCGQQHALVCLATFVLLSCSSNL